MKTMKSLSEFVLWYKDNQDIHKGFINYQNNVLKYAHILRQKPELWMFIACDAKGEPMKKPELKDYWEGEEYQGAVEIGRYESDLKKYQKAKVRCWFKGWILKEFTHPKRKGIQNSNKDGIILKEMNSQTIESLLVSRMELTITETLIKKLGL